MSLWPRHVCAEPDIAESHEDQTISGSKCTQEIWWSCHQSRGLAKLSADCEKMYVSVSGFTDHVVDDANSLCDRCGLEAHVGHAVDQISCGNITASILIEVDSLHFLCSLWNRCRFHQNCISCEGRRRGITVGSHDEDGGGR